MLDEFELTPLDTPSCLPIPVDMRETLEVAIRNRPEINVAVKQIKGSAVRLKMSKNELLPVLDVLLETYVAGLRGDSGIGSAFGDQFDKGGPSYTAGLQFEVPLRNREARARFQRRALELRQFQNQFRNTLHALQLEVEIAVREVRTSFREIEANHQAMLAAGAEVDYIAERWRLLPGEDRSASLVLEDLLAAQERLAAVEFEFSNAQVNYSLALTNLKRTMGTLLQFERIAVGKTEQDGIPSLWLQKTDAAASGVETAAFEFATE
jgi:outer membrane protein TolC